MKGTQAGAKLLKKSGYSSSLIPRAEPNGLQRIENLDISCICQKIQKKNRRALLDPSGKMFCLG